MYIILWPKLRDVYIWSLPSTYSMQISVTLKVKVGSLLLQVVKETAICHERHDDGHSVSCIKAHTNQWHHVRMVQVFHFIDLLYHLL